jgi:hypothetical protein
MKKLFLICLMMLASSAWAEWVMYSETDTEIFYYDPDTIRKDGNMRRVWELQDLKTPNEQGVMSRRFRGEYDCKNESWRLISHSSHSGRMATGETFFSNSSAGNWRDIPPNTISATTLNIICAE